MQRWKEEGEKNSKEQKPEDVCSEELGIDVVDMITVVAAVKTSCKLRNAALEGGGGKEFQRAEAGGCLFRRVGNWCSGYDYSSCSCQHEFQALEFRHTVDFISFASSCERCECMRSHRTHQRVLMTTLEFQFPTSQRCHLRILLKWVKWVCHQPELSEFAKRCHEFAPTGGPIARPNSEDVLEAESRACVWRSCRNIYQRNATRLQRFSMIKIGISWWFSWDFLLHISFHGLKPQ